MANILVFAFFLLFSNLAPATDLGIRGHYFLIQEESLLKFLTKKLEHISRHEMETLNENISAQYVDSFTIPKSLGLKRAHQNNVSYFDPSIVTEEDIKDFNGKVIIPRGTYYNPLESISLSEDLLFFDAEDSKQLAWAKLNRGKWILVNGSPTEIEKKENIPVYFDQQGHLVNKLRINGVPAKVSQVGNRLKIELFSLENF